MFVTLSVEVRIRETLKISIVGSHLRLVATNEFDKFKTMGKGIHTKPYPKTQTVVIPHMITSWCHHKKIVYFTYTRMVQEVVKL